MPFDMFYKSTPAPKSPSCHQLLFLSYPKSRMDDDWDLHAVVRSCCASSAVISQPPPSSFLGCGVSEPCFRISSQPREELRDLCVPFVSNWREAQEEDGLLKPLPQPLFSKQKPAGFSGGAKSDSLKNSARKCKKKRSLMKKQICRVDAEKLSSDGWNWRKYGQKPIKGSPFPRGYYRCSSSKACVARKQVERDRSDPDMFLVTYTSEHNHPPPFDRNSFQTTARATPKPDLEKTEAHDKQMDKDEGDSVISDMAPDDCFFMSMEDPS